MKFTKLPIVVVIMFSLTVFLSSCNLAENLTLGKESDRKLFEGMALNNFEVMNEAIEQGANINNISGIHLSTTSNPLWVAINGQFGEGVVKYLINKGADVNISSSGGLTLLMYWAGNTDVDFCELLIKNGAKVDKEYLGKTALEYTLDHTNRETSEKKIDQIVTLLLKNGAKIKPNSLKAVLANRYSKFLFGVKKRILEDLIKAGYKSDIDPALEVAMLGDMAVLIDLIKQNKMKKEDEQEILFFTSAFGSAEALMLLEEKGLDLDLRYKKFWLTPLIVASNYGNLETVKYLVSKGVNIETRTSEDKSALNIAVENNQYDVVEYLIMKGADIKPFARTIGSIDVLRTAIGNGNMKMMEMLLSNGYILDDKGKENAIILAASTGNKDIIKYLLDLGADINCEDENTGFTPLFNACNLETIKFLVENGAKLNYENGKLYRLNSEAEGWSRDIAEYLIKKGANVNSVIAGETPLKKAIVRGNYEVVKLLVENGANLEFQAENSNGNKNTAIIEAAGCGSRNILEYIIKKGANINYQNEKGQTALMRATSIGRLDNVKLLIQNKADKNLKDNDGKTALDLAKAKGYNNIVDYLKNSK